MSEEQEKKLIVWAVAALIAVLLGITLWTIRSDFARLPRVRRHTCNRVQP